MSTDRSSPSFAPSSRGGHGLACMMGGMMLFAGQDGLMKLLLGTLPLWNLITVRSVTALLILVPLILYLGGSHRLTTPFWRLHLLRAFLFALGFTLFYTAFPFMTLASVTTIFFAGPLILSLLAVIFLGEKISIYRIVALIVGFSGIITIMGPGSDSFQWVSVLPLACAATYAVSQIIMRRIGEQESSLTMGLYTLCFSAFFFVGAGWTLNTVFSLPDTFSHLRWDWSGFDLDNAGWLIALGIIGMFGFILICRAYQVADATLMAPFEYSYIPIATLVGYFAWGEVPKSNTFIGMALIISSGVFIGYREIIAARRQHVLPPTAGTSFVSPERRVPSRGYWTTTLANEID